MIRSEPETELEEIGSKKGPESEILRNSPEFRSEFTTKFKGGKRPNCTLLDANIDALCFVSAIYRGVCFVGRGIFVSKDNDNKSN